VVARENCAARQAFLDSGNFAAPSLVEPLEGVVYPMMKRLLIAAGVLGLAFLAAAQQTKADRTLKIKLSYTGSGKVDEQHRIFVFLFDTPDFMQGGDVIPFARQSVAAKEGTVTFDGIVQSTVYAVAIFDPKGIYDGESAPPSGSSAGIYGQEPGKPGAINLEDGKTTQIDLAFDDTVKVPER
jgi:hypothetical protein